jgi:hypothetical protein
LSTGKGAEEKDFEVKTLVKSLLPPLEVDPLTTLRAALS